MLNYAPRNEGVWGNSGIAPFITSSLDRARSELQAPVAVIQGKD